MSVLPLALRNLARQKRRSLLMGAVIAFGFAAFALAGGFIAQSFEGLRDSTIRQVGNLQIVDRRAAGSVSEQATLEFGIDRGDAARQLVSADPAVEAALPRIEFVGLVTTGGKSIPFLGIGVDPEPEERATGAAELLVEGRWLSSQNPDGIVLGTGLASALGVKVGEGVTLVATSPDGSLNAVDAIVAGLADVKFKELNDRYLVAGLSLAERLLQSEGKVSKLVLFLRKGMDETAAAARLTADLEKRGWPVEALPWQRLAVFYGQVRLLYAGIFGFLGAVLVVIVILAAAIVMTMAVTERTREIGTLRAMGTRPSGVRNMFLAEALLLAVGGCAVGGVLALIVMAALNASGIVLPPPPGGTTGFPIHVKAYPLAYAAGLAVMALTSLAAAYVPARRAARMNIVEALAHV
jgi:putative ABC transport system permease protein